MCGRFTRNYKWEQIHASEIEEITPSRSHPDRGTLKVRSETRNQRDEIVQVLLARLIVPRRVARPQLRAAEAMLVSPILVPRDGVRRQSGA